MLLTILLVTATAMSAGDVWAQSSSDRPPIEFGATYGNMWGGNIGLSGGKLRTGTGPSLGFALDVPLRPGMWLEGSYTRQDGSLDWDRVGRSKTTLTDMSVNVWHLGTIRALGRPDAAATPFVLGSLGATYFSPSNKTVIIDGESYSIDGSTKFSIALGVGVKMYFGEAQRVGVRATFKAISSLFDSGGGVFFGPGGVSLGVSGWGIWQYEVAGGLTVKFGG
jgi:hypothetical protein